MHRGVIFAGTAFMLTLAACGNDPAPDPVEQIVVREPGEAAQPAANAMDGEAAFASCSGCHGVEQGAPSAAGPNLFGVVGREAASLDDFAYSDALASSGITWTEAELDAFIADPTGKVPGTTMSAGGVSDAERRAAIVAYLKTLTE